MGLANSLMSIVGAPLLVLIQCMYILYMYACIYMCVCMYICMYALMSIVGAPLLVLIQLYEGSMKAL